MVTMNYKKTFMLFSVMIALGMAIVGQSYIAVARPTEGSSSSTQPDKDVKKNSSQSQQQDGHQSSTQNPNNNQSKKSAGNNGCGTDTSIIRCDPDSDENPIINLLQQTVKILYGVIGVLAVVVIMIAGVVYGTAGDREDRVKLAKTMITNTIVGILLYVFMTVILNFLVPGGVF